jgi:acetaldehyde dehydrogenase (acetylating)
VYIAQQAGITVPQGTRILVVEPGGVGRDYPLSIEKLCPVLSLYEVADWREGCERCKQILRYGGMGHTMSIHSRDDRIVLEFGLKKPAFRIVVNTPTTHGSIGLTTGLDPAMTLGCGGYGGNITSDNISPRHLLNIKRVAYEVRPPATGSGRPSPSAVAAETAPALPKAPAKAPRSSELAPSLVQAQVAGLLDPLPPASQPPASIADFVCEDDVREALRQNRKIVIGDRTIVTPSARDLADAHGVFVTSGWPAGR